MCNVKWLQRKAPCYRLAMAPLTKPFMIGSRHVRNDGSCSLSLWRVCCQVSNLQNTRFARSDKWCRSSTVFVQATFVPSIPQIAEDLRSTHAVVRCVFYGSQAHWCLNDNFPSLSVSLSIFAGAVGALVWAAYSSFCELSGRGIALDLNLNSQRWTPIDLFMRDAGLMHRELWCCNVNIVVESIILAIHSVLWVLRRHVIRCWCYRRHIQVGGEGHWYWDILWCEGWLLRWFGYRCYDLPQATLFGFAIAPFLGGGYCQWLGVYAG
jgi:hypothetical protein